MTGADWAGEAFADRGPSRVAGARADPQLAAPAKAHDNALVVRQSRR